MEVIMEFYDLTDEINELVEKFLTNVKSAPAEEFWLDKRCGTLLYGDDFIAVENRSLRSLNYYGGFEYVEKEHITTLGDYTFFSDESDRVRNALDFIHDDGTEEDEE
jgi:hypothetical protein